MDVARLILDYIDSLKWPALLTAFAFVVVFFYRPQFNALLAGLADRLRGAKVGPTGVELMFDQGEATNPPAPNEPLPNEPVALETTKLVGQLAKEYASSMLASAREIEQWRDAYEKVVTDYSTTRLYWFYEWVYRMLFQSQIDLLRALMSVYPQGLSEVALHPFYQRVSDLGWDFPGYVQFLVGNGLVTYDGAEYQLADYGRGFLEYSNWQQLPPKQL